MEGRNEEASQKGGEQMIENCAIGLNDACIVPAWIGFSFVGFVFGISLGWVLSGAPKPRW